MARKKISVEKQVKKAKEIAKREIAKARVKLAEAEKKVTAYAKKNPRRAMLIAGAVGAAVGAGVAVALSRLRKKQ